MKATSTIAAACLVFAAAYAAAQPATWGTIRVTVPAADAKVSINGTKTTSAGLTRTFYTGLLPPGRHLYVVAVTWSKQGEETSESRDVLVSPGEISTVDFTRPK